MLEINILSYFSEGQNSLLVRIKQIHCHSCGLVSGPYGFTVVLCLIEVSLQRFVDPFCYR